MEKQQELTRGDRAAIKMFGKSRVTLLNKIYAIYKGKGDILDTILTERGFTKVHSTKYSHPELEVYLGHVLVFEKPVQTEGNKFSI